MLCQAERTGADAELALECVIEVRRIAEPAVERDVEHPRGAVYETRGGLAQPCPHHVLVRAHTREPLEDPDEMERAQIRSPGECVEGVGIAGSALDRPHDVGDASLASERRSWG